MGAVMRNGCGYEEWVRTNGTDKRGILVFMYYITCYIPNVARIWGVENAPTESLIALSEGVV